MSESNIDLAQRAFEAASRQPKPHFETVNALFHPDHEFVASVSQVEGRSFRGAAGFREWMKTYGESISSFEAEVESATELDQGRVLLAIVTRGKGKSSGASFSARRGFVMTVRDGKVVRTVSYSSPEEALEAAGVTE